MKTKLIVATGQLDSLKLKHLADSFFHEPYTQSMYPEYSRTPGAQVEYGRSLVKALLSSNEKRLVATYSPYIIHSFDVFVRYYSLHGTVFFYIDLDGTAIDCTEDKRKMYTDGAEAFRILDDIEDELQEDSE